ncbi:glycosyltransferase [Sporolactobacillus sp. THM7-7]|nr:glycosyltransferase [Sporolactobacillus sp. THM7-7]
MRCKLMSPLLSLCMIVKNEENVLKRCLDSVKDGVDEIVVVDTGSTDKTKEIAGEYTDKLYDYEWTNSFADARNYAQSKATGEWILALDADEFVDYDNLMDLRKELRENVNHFDVGLVKIFNFTGQAGQLIYNNYHVRIYRNDPSINYYRAIHEQLKKTDGSSLKEQVSSLVVYHSGYLTSTVDSKNKHKRNKALIDKEVRENGQTGFDYFNLGNEYLSHGDTEKALDHYVKAYKKRPDVRYSWVGPCVLQIIQCLIQLKRYKDALNVIRDSEAIFSRSPEFKTMRGRIFLLQGRINDAEHELIRLVDNKDDYTDTIISPDYLKYFPYKFLGYIYEKKEDLQKAVFHYSKAFHFNLNDEDLLRRYFRLLLQNTSPEAFYQFLLDEKLLENKNSAKRLMKVIVNLSDSNEFVSEILDHSFFNEDFGAQAKYLLIQKQPKDAFKLISQLSPKQLIYIFNEGIFDFFDFLILCLLLNQQKLLAAYTGMMKQVAGLVDLLSNGKSKDKVNPSIYLIVLKRLIRLEQFDLFEKIVGYKTFFDKSINIRIGHLLYNDGFCDLAVSFYQEAGTSLFDEQTYLNVMEQFKKQNMLEDAFQFALRSLNKGYQHFSLIKDVIEIANQVNDEPIHHAKRDLAKFALKLYPDSKEMREVLFANR